MTSEQALFLRDFLLPLIEEESSATRRVLAAIPERQRDYRPDPKSRTARELAWHIVSVELQFFDGIAGGSFEGMAQEPSDPTTNTAELVAYYETKFKAGLEKVKRLSGERLATELQFFTETSPAVKYLIYLVNHTIHHRGQLSAYLRPMGSKVPSIYGPSADEGFAAGEGAGA